MLTRPLACLAGLQAADMLTTRAVLAHETAREGNPLAASLLSHGWAALIAGKLAMTLILGVLAVVVARRRPALALAAVFVVTLYYSAVVALNLYNLGRL